MITENELAKMTKKEILSAITMGELNFSSVKDEFKPELRQRIDLLRSEYFNRTGAVVDVLHTDTKTQVQIVRARI